MIFSCKHDEQLSTKRYSWHSWSVLKCTCWLYCDCWRWQLSGSRSQGMTSSSDRGRGDHCCWNGVSSTCHCSAHSDYAYFSSSTASTATIWVNMSKNVQTSFAFLQIRDMQLNSLSNYQIDFPELRQRTRHTWNKSYKIEIVNFRLYRRISTRYGL